MAIDVSSRPVFLSKKRRIGMDVSSGLIFLKKKRKSLKKYIKPSEKRTNGLNSL